MSASGVGIWESGLATRRSQLSSQLSVLDYSNILNTKHLHRAITFSWPESKLCTPLFLAPPPPRLSAERFELQLQLSAGIGAGV